MTTNSPSRIQPTTVANAAENERLAPISPPGDGGWTPSTTKRLALSVAVGVLGALGTAMAAPIIVPAALIAAMMVGAAGGIATFLGTGSAGTRKL